MWNGDHVIGGSCSVLEFSCSCMITSVLWFVGGIFC